MLDSNISRCCSISSSPLHTLDVVISTITLDATERTKVAGLGFTMKLLDAVAAARAVWPRCVFRRLNAPSNRRHWRL